MNIQFPVSWLRDYIKTDAAAKTIASMLTACGPSVERTEKLGDDYIWDIEVTTNRPDAYSVFGIAREAYAILNSNGQRAQLVNPKGIETSLEPEQTNRAVLNAKVQNPNLCPRFAAVVLEIKVKESPALIKNRLRASGIRPINNIVDITNYVMLETGQPMHAFDFDKIAGSKMNLRESKAGETMTTLDGKKHSLPTGSIVIEDAKKIIDLCGIMGGENSQITTRTKKTVFFVQSYNPIKIRKTSQALALRTEASARFEKGVDLENIPHVMARSVYLAKKIAGAKIISELIDIYPSKQKSEKINLSLKKLNKYLGIDISPSKTSKILENLGFTAETSETTLTAIPPTYRAQDIKEDVDLIEEIARIYGYSNLPSDLPQSSPPTDTDSYLKQVIGLKKSLKYIGLTEAITYSIISKKMLALTQIEPKNAVELLNPLTEEWQFMRPSIIPSLLEVVTKNQNLKNAIKIFEIAKTYDKNKSGLPTQDTKLALVITEADFYDIKGIVENIFQILKREPTFKKMDPASPLYVASQSAYIKVGDKSVGGLGQLNPKITSLLGIDNNIAVAEINLSTIYTQPSIKNSFKHIAKYPPRIEDLSAIFSVNTPLGDIVSEIKKASGLIKSIDVIDIFLDPKIGDNKKSVTLSISYQKPTGTPDQDEVNVEKEKIEKALETNLRAKVRR